MARTEIIGPLSEIGSQEVYLGGNILNSLYLVIVGTITVQIEVSNGGNYWSVLSGGDDVTSDYFQAISPAYEKLRLRVSSVAGGTCTGYLCFGNI